MLSLKIFTKSSFREISFIVSLIFLGMNLSDVISNSQKVKELKKYKNIYKRQY